MNAVKIAAQLGTAFDENLPPEVRARACAEIGSHRFRPAIPSLLKLGSIAGDPLIVWQALDAVGAIGSKTATRPLLQLIRDSKSAFVRQAAVFAVGQLADPRARPHLIRVLKNKSELPKTRGFAAEALGLLRSQPASSETLISALGDVEPEVRCAAVSAIAALRDRRAVPALRSLLTDRTIVDGDRTLSEFASDALRTME